jgi:hypothetical protein
MLYLPGSEQMRRSVLTGAMATEFLGKKKLPRMCSVLPPRASTSVLVYRRHDTVHPRGVYASL